jgi:hypothetical protein
MYAGTERATTRTVETCTGAASFAARAEPASPETPLLFPRPADSALEPLQPLSVASEAASATKSAAAHAFREMRRDDILNSIRLLPQ